MSGSANGAERGSEMTTERYDVVIVGGGIVGLSTALALSSKMPGVRLLVLEKEAKVGSHQTGHNSGVVHSGVYYRPGSLKATLTQRGNELLREFCVSQDFRIDEVGKVIVATNEVERERLQALFARGSENGVPGIRLIDRAELLEIEPNSAGIQAIHCPHTAIVDYAKVCERLAGLLESRGASVRVNSGVTAMSHGPRSVTVEGADFRLEANFVVNCAGLHADRIASMLGVERSVQIIPFRGEYYELSSQAEHLVNGLIYPVPNPQLPFLGVHFTRMVNGGVEAGPNAVLAFSREGYRRSDLDLGDVGELARYGGFWRLAARYWPIGMFEMFRSVSKPTFVRSLQKLVPSIQGKDLKHGPSGVRAQAVDRKGALVDDFVIHSAGASLHVLNAPSPAATAGLAIGEHIAALVSVR